MTNETHSNDNPAIEASNAWQEVAQAADIVQTIINDREKRKAMFAQYRSIMMETFNQIGLSQASAHFDGSNDSGMVEYIDPPEDFEVDIKKIMVTVDGKETDLYDFLENFAYEILSDKVGGWEINAGAFGDVVFSSDGNVRLDFNGRIENYYHEEYEIFDVVEVLP